MVNASMSTNKSAMTKVNMGGLAECKIP
jgi:hypothetical protein